jgi:hypothetical protein
MQTMEGIMRRLRDWDLRSDPPVNCRIPVGRDRLSKIHKILGL